ncbi:hypothetical protein SAMN04489743_0986 [Pseudarthrobacter equi]|uniref:Uncharacterized protein n=1 Tax=Pseudarthrobacter equi TaxID=728066 RepID=A0A1H1VHB0_9MICC|nr:hypothetical protein [Pseudarthrobacter equi]SDS83479.1 hypothetical protein SAMN04489743_0986 [Pseudarthrobacter equi]
METVSGPAVLTPASPSPASPPAVPSVHVRAVITWLAIFPLVALGMMATAPLTEGWHPVFKALALTLMVVPTAVYLVVPRMMRAHASWAGRRVGRS